MNKNFSENEINILKKLPESVMLINQMKEDMSCIMNDLKIIQTKSLLLYKIFIIFLIYNFLYILNIQFLIISMIFKIPYTQDFYKKMSYYKIYGIVIWNL